MHNTSRELHNALVDVVKGKFIGGVMKVKLGELTKIKTGKLDANASSPDGEYPFFTCSKEPLKISSYSYDCECVLVAGNGDLNVKYYNGKFDAYQRTYIIEDNSNGRLYLPYLYYFMNGYVEELRKLSIGGVIKYIKLRNLTDALIELPEIETQKYIVSILSKIKELIDFRYQELKMLENLIKARFVEMFGDPVENPRGYYVATLQDLIEKGFITYHLDGNHGGDYPRSEEFVESGIPYISANCIVHGEIDFAKAKYLTPERAGKLRKGIAQNEDVLFAHNATVGPTVVLHTDEEKVILGTSLTAYRCNQEEIMPNYLKAYMLSNGFVRQYSSEMKQTTRNQVPITAQKKYQFLIPPIEEQKQFTDVVNQIDKSKSNDLSFVEFQ